MASAGTPARTPPVTAVVLLLAAAGAAGCLGADDTVIGGDLIDHDAIAARIGTPIVMDHDHNDLHAHTGSHNMDFVAWSDLGVTLGDNGFANFVLWQDDDEKLAFVAIDGDTAGGFAIVDVADPADLRVLGTYWVDGNSIQEVRVTPDGRYAVMNIQEIPDPTWMTDLDGPGDCTVCLHVVDIQDRSTPVLSSVMPVELLGTHNMHFEPYEDALYLFYVGQPLYNPFPDPGDHIYIARFVEDPLGARLVPVRDFAYNEPGHPARSFPHDVMVQDHPDGRKVAYVSYWDAGHVAFDVTDPLLPTLLGVHDDPTPSDALAVHWMMQEQAARPDGRVIAWSAPEIGSLDSGTGLVRALDVTDPAAIRQVGHWRLPGALAIEGGYILSPHTAIPDPTGTLLAVSHYHAGLWILDITDPTAPRHLAYAMPHGDPAAPYDGPLWWKKPNFDPAGYGPNVYQARWDPDDTGLLWVTDRGTGLYALQYVGPTPEAPLAGNDT